MNLLYASIPIGQNINANITDVGSYSSNIVALMLSMAGLATFIYLGYGGLMWITASGDKTKIEEARSKITNALIGLGIVASSWAIFLLLNHFFGLGMVGGGSSSGGNGSNSGGVSYVCISTSQCDRYCPNDDYVTKRNGSCGEGRVYCACVNKANPLSQ